MMTNTITVLYNYNDNVKWKDTLVTRMRREMKLTDLNCGNKDEIEMWSSKL